MLRSPVVTIECPKCGSQESVPWRLIPGWIAWRQKMDRASARGAAHEAAHPEIEGRDRMKYGHTEADFQRLLGDVKAARAADEMFARQAGRC